MRRLAEQAAVAHVDAGERAEDVGPVACGTDWDGVGLISQSEALRGGGFERTVTSSGLSSSFAGAAATTARREICCARTKGRSTPGWT